MSQHLENADNAMTAITVGSAAVAGAASQVAPPEVKQAIASGRKKCGRWFDKAKKKYRRTYLIIKVLNAMLNVSLYFLDIFTDVINGVHFLYISTPFISMHRFAETLSSNERFQFLIEIEISKKRPQASELP